MVLQGHPFTIITGVMTGRGTQCGRGSFSFCLLLRDLSLASESDLRGFPALGFQPIGDDQD